MQRRRAGSIWKTSEPGKQKIKRCDNLTLSPLPKWFGGFPAELLRRPFAVFRSDSSSVPDSDPFPGLGRQPIEFCPELHEEFRAEFANHLQAIACYGIEFLLGKEPA